MLEVLDYEAKLARLRRELGALPGAIVAFSGGVDSTALLWACLETVGRERTVAVTADSASYPSAEKQEAVAIASAFGVRHVLLGTEELERPEYRANGPDRCYWCKTELFDQIAGAVAKAELPDWPILFGAIADDLADHRPGARAAAERGVRGPLQECFLSKEEVRRYSRERSLPTADKPAFACLASRVPHGTAIDAELLRRIEQAEDWLRQRGFRQFRVRHHGALCRIELEGHELGRAVTSEREGIVRALGALGWAWVTLDLRGR